MKLAAVTVLVLLVLKGAPPAQAQVGFHAGAVQDLWERDAGYEETYFLAGVSSAPGNWEYRASAVVLVRQTDSSVRMGGEVAANRKFFRGNRLEPSLGIGGTIYQTDTMPGEEKGIDLAPLFIAGATLPIARSVRFRFEYRGVYLIFPSMFAGISFASGVLASGVAATTGPESPTDPETQVC